LILRWQPVALPKQLLVSSWVLFAFMGKAMRFSRHWIGILCLLLLPIFLPSCLPSKKLTVGAAASLVEEVAKSSSEQSDLRMVQEGMPAYLLLMDGMVEAWPENEKLLIGAAQAYSSYASAFVEDQDQEYARLLYGRAKEYALRSLALRDFKDPLLRPFDDFEQGLSSLGREDVPYMFWAATCWGNWISLNMNSMEALAELPRVEQMMRRVLELDEGFYYGGPHLFMGIYCASRPEVAGGDLLAARGHFLRAIELGQGQFLMAYVYYANHYARRAFDKDLFISTLQKVLDTPADISPELTLLNTVARTKARELLSHVDEYFE
jgi:hypothetical protein